MDKLNRIHFIVLIMLASLATRTLAVEEPEAFDNKTLVILGASYAGAWSIQSIGDHTVFNAGVDGNQSFEMLERFQKDVVSRSPDKVLVWGFINDIFRTDPASIVAAKQRIQDSYVEIVNAARVDGIEVILATEVTIRQQSGFLNWIAGVAGRLRGKTSYQEMINFHVGEVNDWLRSFAETQEIPLLDFEKALAGDDGMRKSEYAVDDGSHLTPTAYMALTNYTEKSLQLAVK